MYILNDLWLGNITPNERYVLSGTEYQELSEQLSIQLTAFAKELSHDNREQYESIENLRIRLNYISEEDNFIVGFRLGARMILDVIGNMEDSLIHLPRINTGQAINLPFIRSIVIANKCTTLLYYSHKHSYSSLTWKK